MSRVPVRTDAGIQAACPPLSLSCPLIRFPLSAWRWRRPRRDDGLVTDKPVMRVARVYDEPAPDDGVRVLVDRLWPRGLRKGSVPIDHWCKRIAPSTELRRWYGHQRERFAEFASRYERELDDEQRREALADLRRLAQHQTVTLLTAVKDVEISHAAVLADVLGRHRY